MLICAALMALGGLIAWLTVRDPRPGVVAASPRCTVNCGVSAPPLEPREREGGGQVPRGGTGPDAGRDG